jgi:hypothetical protein
MKHTAIILKKLYPHEQKIALLDQKKGRINAHGFNQSFIEGAIIHYSSETRYGALRIDEREYLYVPLQWGVRDILFLHHVLEICYHFIPLESCVDGIFDLLCMLFKHEESEWVPEAKKFFLCKLFLLLGMYTQTNFMKTKIAANLLYISIEDMIQLKIDHHEQILIDQWLMHCIAQHHLGFDFKTIGFLTESR